MTKLILDIKTCIAEAHAFTANLGQSNHDQSNAISKEYLLSNVKGLDPTKLQIALIEMKEAREIEFDSLNDTIFLTQSYQP
ncbi:hypothetical protein SYJ56_15205 [Algoriphagus sp. D3-2-R+10]|uniref:hypothetical protein n=1 Tax=Algoriphagus aurantiacus TaxID=3103948 RepID=UPI002B3B64C2|nr:hypothetical protein [Algoriphagus sp. D3-2-R+10]MEB2776671.1 hypothetical protein [Algoriphagus sp. D3-2-R+10]